MTTTDWLLIAAAVAALYLAGILLLLALGRRVTPARSPGSSPTVSSYSGACSQTNAFHAGASLCSPCPPHTSQCHSTLCPT
jgi:hypothetical protein